MYFIIICYLNSIHSFTRTTAVNRHRVGVSCRRFDPPTFSFIHYWCRSQILANCWWPSFQVYIYIARKKKNKKLS